MDTGLSFFGRKGLPQGKALSLLTSPHNDAQLQVPRAGSEGQEIGLGKGTGALKKLTVCMVRGHYALEPFLKGLFHSGPNSWAVGW